MLAASFDRMGKQQDVAFALMIALSVKVRNVFPQRISLDKHSSFTDLTQRSA